MRPFFSLGRFGWFCADFTRALLRHRPPIARSIEEAYKIGVGSLPILLLIATFVGTNLTLQGYAAFKPLGGQHLVGMFVGLAGVRELAPIVAASIIASKAGTEMASQVAVMRIREQIDALEVMAVSPHWYLIAPRLLGILLVLPALTLIAIATMVVAGWGVSVFQLGLNGHVYTQLVVDNVGMLEISVSVVKSLIFGVLVSLICCYNGYYSKPGPEGVGSATNMAVVTAAISCMILNYVVSDMVYG